MVSTGILAVGALVVWAVYRYVSGLLRNIAIARKTGLPYVVYPIHPLNVAWQLTSAIWLPLFNKLLPKSWEGRLIPMNPDWSYRTNQTFFEWAGGESVIILSHDQMVLYTECAEVIRQVTMRREAFPKDIARYGLLTMFGQNVLTTEAAIWRMHRRVTASSFNEKNAAHTFREAIEQTKGMIQYFFRSENKIGDSTKTIRSLEHDTIIWALNIIGYVGFGLRLLFPGQKVPDDPILARYGSPNPPPGYTLSFADSLGGLLERIIAILLLPEKIMPYLPFEFSKKAWEAKDNYRKYMAEFLEYKTEQVRKGNHERMGMDIMGELVEAVYGEKDTKKSAELTNDEIISNAFIMTVAGHETTANILHFTLVELATNPAAQRRLQKDIDDILGDADSSTWDYDRDVNTLLASHVGACINETLRTMPPVTGIPKIVSSSSDQSVTIDGQKYVLPAGLSIILTAPPVHRNPKYWPSRPSERTGKSTDLEEWIPDRWYRETGKSPTNADDKSDEDTADYGGFQGSDTSASLFRPVRGSFIPFSDGPRSCLGRRIAVVELAAALPGIFQKHSLELAVDEWASDEEVERMSAEERRKLYKKAQESSRDNISKAGSIITLKLLNGRHVPLRLVKRGKERFISDLELD
ncbi:hypothetical protein OQA88_6132 [Cercophora sp. LCS_1]